MVGRRGSTIAGSGVGVIWACANDANNSKSMESGARVRACEVFIVLCVC